MKKIFFVIAVVALGFMAGCKKCESRTGNDIVCTDSGLIHYHAQIIPDICQLSIQVGNTYYLPLVLDSAFLVDSLPVKMCYTFTGDSQFCGFVNSKYPQIDIKAIQNK